MSEATRSDGTQNTSPNPQLVRAAQVFAHIKRDLVRLLGTSASQNRAIQDRVRECGGLPVVMNLCVVDDYNPCGSLLLREAPHCQIRSRRC